VLVWSLFLQSNLHSLVDILKMYLLETPTLGVTDLQALSDAAASCPVEPGGTRFRPMSTTIRFGDASFYGLHWTPDGKAAVPMRDTPNFLAGQLILF